MTTEQTLDRPSGDRAPGGSGTRAATGAGAPEPAAPASTASSRRAYARRQKRREKMSAPRMVTPGKPVASALNRAPFVVVLIAILGGGIAAVLWLNTLTDEAGMRTSTARSSSTGLRLTIEALQRDVANLDSTPRIADDAAALGMVPVGDAAMLVIDAVIRLVPGVLGDERSSSEDSFSFAQGGRHLLEFGQYTRPREYRGHIVPEVLLSGNHQEIARWRMEESVRRTRVRRTEQDSQNNEQADNDRQ